MKEMEGEQPAITREGVSNSCPNFATKTDTSKPHGAAFLLQDEN